MLPDKRMLPDRRMLPWLLALSSLQRHIPVMLLYVVESKGSSPGRQGFFMVVNAGGEMEGSIGGGIMEHKFTEMARELLRQGKDIVSIHRQVHDKEQAKDQSGMICSGEQTILLYSLRAADEVTVGRILESLGAYGKGCLRLSPGGMEFSAGAPGEGGALGEGAAAGASGEAGAGEAGVGEAGAGEADVGFERRWEGDWVYRERTGYTDRLFIVGGGHCALALSRVMRTMDFYISLFDDRSGLESLARNEYVHEKILIRDYDELRELITGGQHDYVVVMTQGYRTDDRAVRALLGMDFRYFGLLGSRAKILKMVEAYRLEGISEDWLGKMRAPAGLAIHSQTPEEIAVSIAAEIIQVKHGGG